MPALKPTVIGSAGWNFQPALPLLKEFYDDILLLLKLVNKLKNRSASRLVHLVFYLVWMLVSALLPWLVTPGNPDPLIASKLYFLVLMGVLAFSAYDWNSGRRMRVTNFIFTPLSPGKIFLKLWTIECFSLPHTLILIHLISWSLSTSATFSRTLLIVFTGSLMSGLALAWTVIIFSKFQSMNRSPAVLQWMFTAGMFIYFAPLLSGVESLTYGIPYAGWYGLALKMIYQNEQLIFFGILFMAILSTIFSGQISRKIFYPYRVLNIRTPS